MVIKKEIYNVKIFFIIQINIKSFFESHISSIIVLINFDNIAYVLVNIKLHNKNSIRKKLHFLNTQKFKLIIKHHFFIEKF